MSHVAAADVAAFERWADGVERVIGPLAEDDLARMRSYYERCLLITHRENLPLLRTAFTQVTEWLKDVQSAGEGRADSRWLLFRAVAAALAAVTASAPGSVRGLISEWYGSVIRRIDVDLFSDKFDKEIDDLTAVQAAGLRSLLDAASGTVSKGGRLQVAIYRGDSSAQLAVTSDSADLHSPLVDFVRLLDECVSHLACVQTERG